MHPKLRPILILALILRAILPILSWSINGDTNRFFYSDTPTYVTPAEELLNTTRYAVDNQPELLRPPGYPLFLIPGLLTHTLVFTTLTLQMILSVITVGLVYHIAYHLTSHTKTAQCAGWLAALEPLSIIYTSCLLTETLFTTLLLAGLWALIRAHNKPTSKTVIIAALFFASATYVRPISLYLPCILIIPLILSRWPWQRTVLFLVVTLGLPGIWIARNIAVANYTGFSAISAVNLYFYQGASVKSQQNQISFIEYQNRLGYRDHAKYLAFHPNQKAWPPQQRYQYMSSEGLKIILNSPLTYASIHIKGLIRTLFDPGTIDLLKHLNLYPKRGGLLGQISDRGLINVLLFLLKEHPLIFGAHVMMGILLMIYYSLAFLSFKTKISLPVILILTTVFYFVLLSGGPHSLNRFRHPIMPMIAILAGIGYCHFRRPLQQH